jgi:GntR family transcriptional regulator
VCGVRHAENGPFQHVTAWVPTALATALSEEDLSKSSVIGAIERQLGVPIKFVEQVAEAALAPRQVAELLQVRQRTPILLFERTYYSVAGKPIEHAVTYQSGRRYPYRVVLSRSDRWS